MKHWQKKLMDKLDRLGVFNLQALEDRFEGMDTRKRKKKSLRGHLKRLPWLTFTVLAMIFTFSGSAAAQETTVLQDVPARVNLAINSNDTGTSSLTIANEDNRAIYGGCISTEQPAAITYGVQTMTHLNNYSAEDATYSFYWLPAPAVGTDVFTIDYFNSVTASCTFVTMYNVNQTTPYFNIDVFQSTSITSVGTTVQLDTNALISFWAGIGEYGGLSDLNWNPEYTIPDEATKAHNWEYTSTAVSCGGNSRLFTAALPGSGSMLSGETYVANLGLMPDVPCYLSIMIELSYYESEQEFIDSGGDQIVINQPTGDLLTPGTFYNPVLFRISYNITSTSTSDRIGIFVTPYDFTSLEEDITFPATPTPFTFLSNALSTGQHSFEVEIPLDNGLYVAKAILGRQTGELGPCFIVTGGFDCPYGSFDFVDYTASSSLEFFRVSEKPLTFSTTSNYFINEFGLMENCNTFKTDSWFGGLNVDYLMCSLGNFVQRMASVLFTPKKTIEQRSNEILNSVTSTWPISYVYDFRDAISAGETATDTVYSVRTP